MCGSPGSTSSAGMAPASAATGAAVCAPCMALQPTSSRTC
jgi:hypothetical protein